MGRMIKPEGVKRQGNKLVPQIDGMVAIPQLGVMMNNGRAVMRVNGLIMGDAGAVAGKYVAPAGLTTDPATATNLLGAAGQNGASVKGDEGADGWSPVLAGEADGTRTLIKVMDWTGGEGTKPAAGMYIGTTGYVATKALAFNFNSGKRVAFYQALTAAGGIATLNFTAEKFTNSPVIVPLQATTAGINGTSKSTVVAGSITATQAQIKVEVQALITGLLTVLVGATVNALVIEQ